MSRLDDQLRERLERLACAAADGQSIDPDRDAGSLGVDARALAENLGIVARIVGARAPEGEGADPPGSFPTAAEDSTDSRWAGPDPQHIGPYHIIGRLGEGGMGIVYEAEQRHPRRLVALKVIRGGHRVDPHALRLFQREIQTLARLSHPGIAQLYEAGVTDDELHYFAMELVRGSPLSEWLRQRGAGPMGAAELRLRLGLFRKICDAVAFAHQKGVIHRDLKPGNILIPTLRSEASAPDAVPEVKILDFGLARMTDTDVQMSTLVTEVGKVQGTLPYMSPEQARGNADEIDLRSDVYSLGVILYQMLAGRLPLDVSRAALPEAMRIICEQAPRSLTTTFSGSRPLDADVATIVGKCLEKEAARRYQSAAALAEDVQRYLADLPIQARPPSTAYQFRKLVRRHKGPFAAAAGAFVLLIAFSVAMSTQAARLARERDRANAEAETARHVSDFMEEIFRASDPWVTKPEDVSVRRLLDDGAERIERDLSGSPAVQARLMRAIGIAYRGMGMIERSVPLLRRSAALTEQTYGADSLEMADVLNELWEPGNDARAHAIRTRLLPPDDPHMARSWYHLGKAELFLNDPRGEASLKKALELVEASPASDEQLHIWVLNDLAIARLAQRDFAAAASLLRKALELREHFYRPDHPDRVSGVANLGWVLLLAGETVEARQILESALVQSERAYGPDHPGWANAAQSLGELNRIEGRYAEARDYLQRALSIYESQLRRTDALHDVPNPWVLVDICTSLGLVEEATGRLDEAVRILGRSREVYLMGKWPATQDPSPHYARVLRSAGRTAEAEAIERESGG